MNESYKNGQTPWSYDISKRLQNLFLNLLSYEYDLNNKQTNYIPYTSDNHIFVKLQKIF